jgi:hypothetical protein
MGMTKSVRNVVAVKPPMTVTAIGDLNSAPDEVVIAIGIIPKIVARAVRRTGLNRVAAPCRIASLLSIPLRMS